MSQSESSTTPKSPAVGVLCSGGGSNLQVLIDRARTGELGGRIAWVVSNNGSAFALERARQAGIEAVHASAKSLGSPEAVESKLLELIERDQVQVLVLAGYMKALPESVLRRLPGRVVNIHPALLPAFGGKGMYGHHVHEAVIARGAQWTGVTIHLVTENYDEGPILRQRVVAVRPDDTPETLGTRVLAIEHDTLWREVRALLERA
ncbi:MAG TPA: phosphoribosylglycinamide formyltransferase [Fibrobacteria bacterium]|nr:phosphoribosylglycinamide formyltransferase [Fibrobacteria bacterium]